MKTTLEKPKASAELRHVISRLANDPEVLRQAKRSEADFAAGRFTTGGKKRPESMEAGSPRRSLAKAAG